MGQLPYFGCKRTHIYILRQTKEQNEEFSDMFILVCSNFGW